MRKKYQRTPKEKRDEIVLAYLRGENTYQKLGKYYGVPPETIMDANFVLFCHFHRIIRGI